MSYRYPVMEKPAQESWRSGFEEQDVELGDDAASLVRAVPLATSARGPGLFCFVWIRFVNRTEGGGARDRVVARGVCGGRSASGAGSNAAGRRKRKRSVAAAAPTPSSVRCGTMFGRAAT